MRPRAAIITTILFLIILGVISIIFFTKKDLPVVVPVAVPIATSTHEVIGKSVEGRTIDAYTYGNGPIHLVFSGGMHGGYEWNSVLLAYEFMDYLEANLNIIPKNISVTIIPVINPDGLFAVIGKEGRFAFSDAPIADDGSGKGRFNANKVDLNRNFDCKWKAESTWRKKAVSGGTQAFSEPEAIAIRDYATKNKPDAFIFWHSQSNAVYASECNNGILPKTLDIMNAYSKASGYPAVDSFSAYPVTGDAEGWLASIGIPAITVELKTHQTLEWENNLAGFKSVLKYYEK